MTTLESRSTTGLVQPRSVSHAVWPGQGGLAIHWAGDHQGLAGGHAACQARLRQWQGFHMHTRGWVDLAYNWVVCQHGVVMVGRGWAVRSAANGSNDGNDRYLAACWLGGLNDPPPSAQALTAFEWLINEVRSRGAGRDVQPHHTFFPTECPGKVMSDHAGMWRNLAIIGKPTVPTNSVAPAFPLRTGEYFGPRSGPTNSISGYVSHRRDLAKWQAKVGLLGDGLYGPKTANAARSLQVSKRLVVDEKIGPKTWVAAWAR